MNCPLCQAEIQPEMNEVHPNYPSYRCGFHYKRYFSADWSYSRYEEYAEQDGYRIINYYNYREGKSDFGGIQKYMVVKGNMNIKTDPKFHTILRFQQTLKVPTQEEFINKIKTYLLFS